MQQATSKIFDKEIILIDKLYQGVSVHLKLVNIGTVTALLEKDINKGFVFKGFGSGRFDYDVGESLKGEISVEGLSLSLTSSFLSNIRQNALQENSEFQFRLRVWEMQTSTFNKSNTFYFRSIYRLKYPVDFFFLLEDIVFKNGNNSSRGLIRAAINGIRFEFFIFKQEEISYLIFDCVDKIALDKFSELEWSLSLGLGYISGVLSQDDQFLFGYNTQNFEDFSFFKYSQCRASIKTFYTPVFSNPYALPNAGKECQEYFGKVRPISTDVFSTLVQIIHNDENIKAIVLLIIESLSSSLILMPAGLSVVMEGLSEYYNEKFPEVLKPVSDKTIAKSFLKDLKVVLEEYQSQNPEFSWEIIKNKISNINSPTNKEKLKAPFIILEISLTKTDEEVLDYRNDFLHGNINLNVRKNNRSYEMGSYEISMRLLTLVNMIIMKMIGYKGHIVNHVKTQLNIETEPLYRTV